MAVRYLNDIGYASDAYIISFSLNKDSLTLWAEYAKKSGINIGIDCPKLRKDVIYDQTGIHEDVFGGRVIYIDTDNDSMRHDTDETSRQYNYGYNDDDLPF